MGLNLKCPGYSKFKPGMQQYPTPHKCTQEGGGPAELVAGQAMVKLCTYNNTGSAKCPVCAKAKWGKYSGKPAQPCCISNLRDTGTVNEHTCTGKRRLGDAQKTHQ